MAEIRSFRELNVYKSAREAARAIFEISKTFPRDERYSLTDQLRRSSRAVNAMIAEAWAKRRYEAAFVSKVNDALGEATETQAWLDHALDAGYITSTQFKELDANWQQIGAMLNKMTERAHDFCKSQTRR
jgi:four helix bundle protein